MSTSATPTPTKTFTTPPRADLATLVPSKTNPRKTFDAADIASLAENIKKHDVIQPLLVRPHPTKAEAFEIVAGERRYRAAKEAGLVDVPVVVRSLSDEEVLEIQIVENLQRRDLSPLEEAEGYNTLLVKKYTHERIADRVGRSVQYVRDRCRLLKLVKGAAELLREGRIEVGHAILLARLAPEDQIRTIREPKPGVYGADRDSGLWQAQRDLPGTSTDDPWKKGEVKPVSVKELAAWIQDHVRLEPAAPQTAELFPEVAEVLTATQARTPGEKPIKFVEITTSHQLNDDTRDPKRRVLGRASWTRADGRAGSKTCANSVVGIVVAGDGQGEAFKICIDKKKCQVHYKAEIAEREKREKAVAKSGKTGEDRHALEEAKRKKAEQKAKEERERIARAEPAIRVAVSEKVKVASLSKIIAVVKDDLEVGDADFDGAAKILPIGKTAEDFLRHAAVAVTLGQLRGLEYFSPSQTTELLKPWGVDAAKIIESANANEAASQAAKPKKKPATKAKK